MVAILEGAPFEDAPVDEFEAALLIDAARDLIAGFE
jgi:hypothetical protein